ncbi:hypothetical protein ACFYE8_33250 [Rhizobium leguminosarum]|uniref:hypothetical protein n=1 Tax=Rhizobium leguminosarum TaxID=384 RepID=UPI0036DA243C
MDDDEKKEGTLGVMPTRLGVVPPEREGQATLTAHQEEIVKAYRAGRMDEVQFQRYLTEDPIIAEYVRRIAHPRDDPRPADWARDKRRDG